ncbi:acyl dehydratase [Nocardioides mangrovicus]|uniref:Acyl dehydratase n=1 Tax=Nocardioides mangrovicus TaxID=2478913 RepID=A0A3L8P877_9ACTN|nr:MaoC/PaaZ C-terminal domain-containing protein [Nocardioides mangrovicus]RLV51217.1 acyl dehydratase [Nocardioides mangrovicus]
MSLEAGEELATQTFRVTRADLVAYAAAAGDPNPIHQDADVARSVGLPGVIAHGMYTLALAARAVDGWAGAPGRVVELGAKFTKPVVVPAGEDGAEVVVAGTVKKVEDGRATIGLTVTCGADKVLGMPTAVVAL